MKMKLFPIYLFLFLFIFDKIFLIPNVRKILVKNYLNSYDVLNQFNEKLYSEHLESNSKKLALSKQKIQNNTIMFFGTSRSAEYANLSENFYKSNPFIKSESISNVPVFSWSIKAAPFIHIYQIYNYYIKTHQNPRMIVLEINHISFNKNSVFKQKKDIYDFKLDDFKEAYSEFSLKDKIEYISNWVFVLNKSTINWKGLFTNKKEDNVDETLDFVLALKKAFAGDSKNQSWELGIKEGTETEQRKKEDIDYNSWVVNSFYQNFQIDETSFNLFKKMVREAREKNIPLVLYRPKIHQLLRDKTKFTIKAEKNWLEQIHLLSKEYNIPFIDFEGEKITKCDYFMDISHLSKTCFPEVIEKIIDITKK